VNRNVAGAGVGPVGGSVSTPIWWTFSAGMMKATLSSCVSPRGSMASMESSAEGPRAMSQSACSVPIITSTSCSAFAR
jgi:hypothetical protein